MGATSCTRKTCAPRSRRSEVSATVALAAVRRQIRNFSEEGFARNADDERSIFHPEAGEIGEQLQIMRDGFTEPDAGIKRNADGIDP